MNKKLSILILSTILVTIYFIVVNFSKQKEEVIFRSKNDFSLANFCRSGKSLKFQDLPEAQLLANIGNSSWHITTKSDSAQIYFNQGLNALHSFWDVEAFRAFKKGIQFDTTNAMLYWGLARSISQTAGELPEIKKNASENAIKFSKNENIENRKFIEAYYELKKGRKAYKKAMEKYIINYPKQLDAKLFYASFLSSGVSTYLPNGIPTEENLRGQELLKEVFISNPKSSALHHYWIHAMENSTTPEKALESAKTISSLAPSSGHITHMPGHIYYRTGNYEKANETFYNSLKVDSIYMSKSKVGSINNWNYIHNLDYLIASCAESGKYNEGLKWAKRISKTALNRARRMSRGSGYILFGAYTSIPRFHIRYGEWEKASKSIDSLIELVPWNGSKAVQYFKGIQQYANGMHNLTQGNIKKANLNLNKLKEIKDDLQNNQSKISADWYYRYALKILGVNTQELGALINYENGEKLLAIKQLKNACTAEKKIGYWEPPHYSRPVLESLALLYTNENDKINAIKTYNKALKLRPKNGHSQFAMAQALEALSTNSKDVKKAYQQFLIYWINADNFNNELSYAKKYIKEH